MDQIKFIGELNKDKLKIQNDKPIPANELELHEETICGQMLFSEI